MTWHVVPYQLTSAEDVWAAERRGELTVPYTAPCDTAHTPDHV